MSGNIFYHKIRINNAVVALITFPDIAINYSIGMCSALSNAFRTSDIFRISFRNISMACAALCCSAARIRPCHRHIKISIGKIAVAIGICARAISVISIGSIKN